MRKLDAAKTSVKANLLAQKFAGKIVGQDPARTALIDLLDKFASGMYNKTKPIGSLLFLGPTGTGKTLVVEAFAEGLFGRDDKMLKVDCAEFQHSHEISKLIGSPPGYLGHRETHAFFTNESLRAARSGLDGKEVFPFTIVLFDEIEKASDSLWALLLGILDKGTLTLGTNEKVDFRNTIIVMTSNVGAMDLANDKSLGFNSGEKEINDKKMEDIAMGAARRKFMPEFLNRLDTIVTFKNLTRGDLQKILALELEKVQTRVIAASDTMFEIQVTEAGLVQLIEAGYDKRYNARHLVRAVEKYIANPLIRLVVTQQIHHCETVICDFKGIDGWVYVAVQGEAKDAQHSSTVRVQSGQLALPQLQLRDATRPASRLL